VGLLQRLLGNRITGTIMTSHVTEGAVPLAPSIELEGDELVLRMHAPMIDPSTVELDTHDDHLRLKASGTKPDGSNVKIEETIRVSGGDESRAHVAKEGDDLVIRLPRG
jgi:hypothetical protein